MYLQRSRDDFELGLSISILLFLWNLYQFLLCPLDFLGFPLNSAILLIVWTGNGPEI
jgi:hypothetical protein